MIRVALNELAISADLPPAGLDRETRDCYFPLTVSVPIASPIELAISLNVLFSHIRPVTEAILYFDFDPEDLETSCEHKAVNYITQYVGVEVVYGELRAYKVNSSAVLESLMLVRSILWVTASADLTVAVNPKVFIIVLSGAEYLDVQCRADAREFADEIFSGLCRVNGTKRNFE